MKTETALVVTTGSVVDAIGAGIHSVKGAGPTNEEITESTCFWLGDDPDQPCLAFDSLDLLELIVFLEEEFGWSIPEDQIDAAEWRTVGDLASVVVRALHGDDAASDV